VIDSPYRTLPTDLGKPDGWHPAWAQRLERQNNNGTTYVANPETLDRDDLADLLEITSQGWDIRIDSLRLNRLRIQISKP